MAGNIKEFQYDPDTRSTFAAWVARYEDLFAKDAERIDDGAKVRLLLRRLGTNEHYRYVSYILPNTPKDFSFSDTVGKLKSLFGTKESTVKKRYCALTLAKVPAEDFVSYACRVNKMCVEFELKKLSEEQFKCLIFVCGIKSECDAEVRTRLLTKIEDCADVTLGALMEECQRLINLKNDTAMIEASASGPKVQAVKSSLSYRKQFKKPNEQRCPQPSQGNHKNRPATPCWKCGAMHYSKFCGFRNHKCADCHQVGHKEGYCSSARRSLKSVKHRNGNLSIQTVTLAVSSIQCKRRYVWVKINDVPVRLQLDTASDITIISEQVWMQIGHPAANPTTQTAKSASGEKLDLLYEFIGKVSLNGCTQNGRVFVSGNSLNLLGIDLIDKFNLWSLPMDKFCNKIESAAQDISALKRVYPELFSNKLGLCTKTKIVLSLKDASKPVFRPRRPVAYAMQAIVDEELDRLERLNIISPVQYSEWAAPIVVVRKANTTIRCRR
ncbi:uncharacterized protein K02A2.6-like [Wyeomyia smithii]|uniref:uncharacterized protein K02A2.6-like n=1 Tax=Wyeomyia smithii TaxID=174621 RepID=UPI0024681364|nr:uncharacterized protein K02A2.6-like [Wyeomyia smithii]